VKLAKYELAKNILEKYFPDQYRSQYVGDWQGSFELHNDLIEYYLIIGPLNLSLPAYGNNFYLPQLNHLWDYQKGYRWNSLTGEKLLDWKDEWLVVGDQGADPFILSSTTNTILFDNHGNGIWEPRELFSNIESMVTCLLILSSIVIEAGKELTNERGHIKDSFRESAYKQLSMILQPSLQPEDILEEFAWL